MATEKTGLLKELEERFAKNINRHPNIEWQKVVHKLEKSPQKLTILQQMEDTGGEPDVVGYDEAKDEFIFFDCASESPSGRRSLCYDQEALDSRKENKPVGSALAMAAEMGVSLLTEEEYKLLQSLGKFDLKTSSWIVTPDAIRKLGGSLFCDRRYNQVFVYHNGASSYYAARGFRASLRV